MKEFFSYATGKLNVDKNLSSRMLSCILPGVWDELFRSIHADRPFHLLVADHHLLYPVHGTDLAVAPQPAFHAQYAYGLVAMGFRIRRLCHPIFLCVPG